MKKLITLCITLCLPLGAQTKSAAPRKDENPIRVASVQFVLDSVQGAYPGNAWMKPCGPKNHDSGCVDPKMHHITGRTYQHKENCEREEKVECTFLGDLYLPIGKAIFEDHTASSLFTVTEAAATKSLEITVTSISDPKNSLRIDRMSDEEYAKLQAARKALADVEAEIEKAHGVDVRGNYTVPVTDWMKCPGTASIAWSGDSYSCYMNHAADKVEWRGQFILIQSGEAK